MVRLKRISKKNLVNKTMDLKRVNAQFNQKVQKLFQTLSITFYESKSCTSDELKTMLGNKERVDAWIAEDPVTEKVGEWYSDLRAKFEDNDKLTDEIFRRGKDNVRPDLVHNHIFLAFGADVWYEKMIKEERKHWWQKIQDIHKTHGVTFKLMKRLGGVLGNLKIDKTKPPNMGDIMSQLFNPESMGAIQELLTNSEARKDLTDESSIFMAQDKKKNKLDIKKFMPTDEEFEEEDISEQFKEMMETINPEQISKMATGLASGKADISDILSMLPEDQRPSEEEFNKIKEQLATGNGNDMLTSMLGAIPKQEETDKK